MTGAALLDRIAAAGAAASLDPDGRVRIAGASRLPTGLLDLLRQSLAEVAEALAARLADAPAPIEDDPAETAERAAMAEHYAAPPDPDPWRPGDPDPLGAGLFAGWLASRVRLAAVSENLEAVRPRRTWGVRELDRQAWVAAAQTAASLPTAEWAAWRATVGSACR